MSTAGPASPPPPAPSPPPIVQHLPPSPIPRRSIEESFHIPTGYGDHRIVLMIRDPWWLYAYWEIHPAREREVRRHLSPEEIGGLRSILRVYDVTDRDFPAEPAHQAFDVALSGLATNWYLHVDAPNRSFVVDIGVLTTNGRFLLLARSNRVTTPRCGPSEVIDEEWMTTDEDYWKLCRATAGIGMGSSPGGFLKELLERQLASPGLAYPAALSAAKPQHPKTFNLSVGTELVVHGTTDPKATVTMQGEPVKLKADGTFSVRVALPDGTQAIPIAATSPDKRETKMVTQTVSRQTEGQPPPTAPTPVETHAPRRRARGPQPPGPSDR